MEINETLLHYGEEYLTGVDLEKKLWDKVAESERYEHDKEQVIKSLLGVITGIKHNIFSHEAIIELKEMLKNVN